MKFHNNRSHNLTEIFKSFGWEEVQPNAKPSDFSLWDTYNKQDVVSKIKVLLKVLFNS